MIDSQAQVRWLAAVLALIVFVIGPVTAGFAIPGTLTTTTEFTIEDQRATDADQPENAGQRVILLVSPEAGHECTARRKADCPSLHAAVVTVPMALEVDAAAALEEIYPGLDVTAADAAEVVRVRETFGWQAAVVTGALLLIAALLALGVLAGRSPRRLFPVTGHQDLSPPTPSPPARDSVPVRRPPPARYPDLLPPVLAVADLPGVREVVHEHGASAKARSHVARTGGYVAVGDVLVWSVPGETAGTDGFAAFPDDDVRVTVGARTPTLDGGLLP